MCELENHQNIVLTFTMLDGEFSFNFTLCLLASHIRTSKYRSLLLWVCGRRPNHRRRDNHVNSDVTTTFNMGPRRREEPQMVSNELLWNELGLNVKQIAVRTEQKCFFFIISSNQKKLYIKNYLNFFVAVLVKLRFEGKHPAVRVFRSLAVQAHVILTCCLR